MVVFSFSFFIDMILIIIIGINKHEVNKLSNKDLVKLIDNINIKNHKHKLIKLYSSFLYFIAVILNIAVNDKTSKINDQNVDVYNDSNKVSIPMALYIRDSE